MWLKLTEPFLYTPPNGQEWWSDFQTILGWWTPIWVLVTAQLQGAMGIWEMQGLMSAGIWDWPAVQMG